MAPVGRSSTLSAQAPAGTVLDGCMYGPSSPTDSHILRFLRFGRLSSAHFKPHVVYLGIDGLKHHHRPVGTMAHAYLSH